MCVLFQWIAGNKKDPAGFLKAVVHNVADLDLLLMHNRKYCAEVAHNVSTQKRKEIVQRAAVVCCFSLSRTLPDAAQSFHDVQLMT